MTLNIKFNGESYVVSGKARGPSFDIARVITVHGDNVTELVTASQTIAAEFSRLAREAFDKEYPDD